MSKAFFVLRLWQTGNIGPHNIAKIDGQPKEGFLIYRDAEKWLEENIHKITVLWDEFIIMMVYVKN